MISFIIAVIKLIVLLGFLIIIHESGHFIVAKMCNVEVDEFSIGFGPQIYKKQGKETQYTVRAIPLGGFIKMEGENEESESKRAFSKASISKRIAIVVAGAVVNIVFGLIVYAFLFGMQETFQFIIALGNSIKQLVTGHVGVDQMVGPVGIGSIISQTNGFNEFLILLSVISVSLGVTNLLPIPALDGGKLLILIIEAIRRKPMKTETEACIQLLGFALLMTLSAVVMYQDISRIIR